MTFWLGRPGNLVALPPPMKGITPTSARASSTAVTIGGGQIVSFAPGPGRRTYPLSWSGLTAEQFGLIEAFHTGAMGHGPFALLDPGRRNLLTANQSSAGSALSSAAGFTVDPTEAVTSTPDIYSRGPRSIRWTLPATVTSGVLDLAPPTGLVGVPAPPGQPWTFNGLLSLSGVAAAVTVTPTLSWGRIDGSEVATTTGTPVAAVAGTWQPFTVSASSPPAGAVALHAQLRTAPGPIAGAVAAPGFDRLQLYRPQPVEALVITARPGSPATGAGPRPQAAGGVYVTRSPLTTTDVLVDQLQLDMYPSGRTWVPGTGVPRVSFVALSDLYKTIPFHSCSATLVEVG